MLTFSWLARDQRRSVFSGDGGSDGSPSEANFGGRARKGTGTQRECGQHMLHSSMVFALAEFNIVF
jgi:hypothetical protein